MEENGGSLTGGETKGARVKSTWRPVAGETDASRSASRVDRKHKIHSLGVCCATMKVRIESTRRPAAATSNKCSHWQRTTSCWM